MKSPIITLWMKRDCDVLARDVTTQRACKGGGCNNNNNSRMLNLYNSASDW